MLEGFRGALRASVALSAVLAAAACGGRTVTPSHSDGGHDAASDAPFFDVPVFDAPVEVPTASDAEAEPPPSGLGLPCNGPDGLQSNCPPDLVCVTGGSDPAEAGRWPGGYCSRSCQGNTDCSYLGGVCSGFETGRGHCLMSCTTPDDCRQGYACRNVSFQTPELACAPEGFIATRSSGVACFQHTDPSAPHYLPALSHSHFGASQQLDIGYGGSDEIAMAIDGSQHIVTGANALGQKRLTNPAFFATGASLPLTFQDNDGPTDDGAEAYSDPNLVVGSDGTFYYSTLSIGVGTAPSHVLVAHSNNHGASWSAVRVNPAEDCSASFQPDQSGVCLDHPWLAIGADRLDPSSEALYAAYLATRPNDYATVLIRSTDGGLTWGIPGSPGKSLSVFSAAAGFPSNLITPAVASNGVVHMVALMAVGDGLGSPQNAVVYARSEDGGQTHTPPRVVNRPGESIPFEQPVIAVDGANLYLAYVSGGQDGAWDVILASSSDDAQSWSYVKVNDEPEACATHFHPAIAVDRTKHRVYVAWYDGRFAPYEGSVAISVCEAAAEAGALHCSPNEAVNDQPFFVTTDRADLVTFLGDYFTLAVRPGGDVWAAFGDTRLGVAHGFIAHGALP